MKKSGLTGGVIAAIEMTDERVGYGCYVDSCIFTENRKSSSHFLNEEKLNHQRPFMPLVSHELKGYSFFLHFPQKTSYF